VPAMIWRFYCAVPFHVGLIGLISFIPLTSRLRQRLWGKYTALERASNIARIGHIPTEELSPPSSREAPPAIALPDEFARVIAANAHSSFEFELTRIASGKKQEGPTIAWRIDNALLADGTLYFNGGHLVLRRQSKRPVLLSKPEKIDEAFLVSYYCSERYFGHWLREALPTEILAAEQGLQGIGPRRPLWLHEPGYRELLTLPGKTVTHARIGRLWMIEDIQLNDGWIRRFQTVRERIRGHVQRNGPSHVMLVRGSIGEPRVLENEPEVLDALAARGFDIIKPESESPRSLVNLLGSARIVILVEGSLHSHALVTMPPGGAIITIQPPRRFNSVIKPFLDVTGMRWGYTVADPRPSGFALPVDRLLRTLDAVEQAIER
jgi:hypothetical protein